MKKATRKSCFFGGEISKCSRHAIDNVFDKLLDAMKTYNVNHGYEHVLDWAQQNKSCLTNQQIAHMIELVKGSKAKKAIKLCGQYF